MMATIHVEIGFAGPDTSGYLVLDDPVRGLLDAAMLAGPDVLTDVTADVASFTTKRGASRTDGPVLRADAGLTALNLEAADRRYDPTNLDGPYVAGGRSQVEPMRPVRIRATWDGVTYPVWRGFADTILTEFGTVSRLIETTVPATDAFKALQAHDRPATTPVGAGEDTGARIHRILDSIGWPADGRDIATGKTTAQATDLGGPALAEMQLVTETEIGDLHIDEAGTVVFRDRHATAGGDVQAVFGDAAGELPYEHVEPVYDAEQLYNLAIVERVGGTAQQADDAASRSAYLTRTWRRSGLLMETDAAAADYAQFVVAMSKLPELRFRYIDIDPRVDPDALWPQVLGRRLGDRITVRRRPPGGGDLIERDVLIRGVEHTYTGETWRTRWHLQSTSKWSALILDDPVRGVLDSNALGY